MENIIKNQKILLIGGLVSAVFLVIFVVIGVLMFNFIANRNENQPSKQNVSIIEDRGSSNQREDKESDTNDDPKVTDTNTDDSNTEQYKIYLRAKINNEEWNGVTQYPGSMFYPNGSTTLGVKSPYLVLIFGESRGKEKLESIMITIKDFKPEIGRYSGILNVLYSGNRFTNVYKDDSPEFKTDFVFEITKWEEKDPNTVIMSANFRGTLKGALLSSDVNVEDGKITDVPVQVVYENN